MTPLAYSTNRRFEWFSSTVTLGLGVGILLSLMLGIKVSGAFIVIMSKWALRLDQVGAALVIIGSLGCVALYANGKWGGAGCYLRWIGCVLRLGIWLHLFGGVYNVLTERGEFFPVIVVWVILAAYECWSIIDSIRDRLAYETSPMTAVSENASADS